MDLLRNLGSAAVSSLVQKSGLNLPFTLGEKNTYFEGRTIWTLHDATKRDDGSAVSVFVFNANQPPRKNLLPFAKNALRKLRTVRHPDVLKFIDAVENDNMVYIMTERVTPLGQAIRDKSGAGREDWIIWGLQRISTALAFVNDSCVSTHGNVRQDSIFVSPSGEWKLGGFELLSSIKDDSAVLYTLGSLLPDANRFTSPEVKRGGWSTLKELQPSAADSFSLGLLIYTVFNPDEGLPPTANPPHPPPTPASRGNIPNTIFNMYKGLLIPTASVRLSPAAFLEAGMSQTGSGFFASNPYVRICTGLDQFNVSNEAEKNVLLRTLREASPNLPPEFASHRVLPTLVSALDFGATAQAILPIVLQLGVHAPPSHYSSIVLAPVTKLFASPDRGTRMALLEHLPQYIDKLDNKTVTDKVWPHLQTGFADTIAVIREATVKSIGLLYPKLNDRIMNNDLLRHLAKMQMDPEAAIRTNTCILLGRIAPALGYNTKKKVLVPAFARSLKDPFVHARVAGIMAFMATIDCFDAEDAATKVIPCISSTLIDKEKLVRDQAFKAVELFVKKLETHAASMPETALNADGQPNTILPVSSQNAIVNSAAGAAGALAGWAMSSLGKKLAPGDLQSNMAPLSADRPASAPPPMNGSSSTSASMAGPSRTTLSPTPSTLSSPAFSSNLGKPKGMQLGATKRTNPVDSWASSDLLDSTDNTDDWGAFSSVPASKASVPSASPSAADDLMELFDDWSPFANPPSSAPPVSANSSFGFDGTGFSTPVLTPTPMKPLSTPVLNPTPVNTMSSIAAPLNSPGSLPPPMVPILVDKATELARRKEERKQRIAMLKEQKKQSAVRP